MSEQAVTSEDAEGDAAQVADAPDTSVKDAQEPDLDELLASYETKPDEPEPEPEKGKSAESARLDRLEREIRAKAANDAVEAIVQNIKAGDENLEHVDPFIISAFLEAKGKDAKLVNAFVNRDSNPGKWKQIEGTLAKELASMVRGPDRNLTADRNAAQAVVRGQSTSEPTTNANEILPQSEINKMSPAEFRAYEASVLKD